MSLFMIIIDLESLELREEFKHVNIKHAIVTAADALAVDEF